MERVGAGIWAEAEEGTGPGQELGFLPSPPDFSPGAGSCPASCHGSYFSFYPCSCPSSCFGPRLLPRPRLLSGSIPAPLQSVLKLSPAPSSPVQLCPEPCSSPATYHACLLQAMLQPSPPPANAPAVLQPSPASLLPCSSPIPALLRPWPDLSLIQSNLLQPSPAYSSPASVAPSPAPIPPSPKFQYLPVEVPCSSLPVLLESLSTMPQLIPALPQPSPDLLKLSSNQYALRMRWFLSRSRSCYSPGSYLGFCPRPDSCSGSCPSPTPAPAPTLAPAQALVSV